MGPANKIKKQIEEKKKEEEITDVLFLRNLKDVMDREIVQLRERLTVTTHNRNNVASILKKLKWEQR